MINERKRNSFTNPPSKGFGRIGKLLLFDLWGLSEILSM